MCAVYIAEAHAADEWPINSTRCAGPGNSVNRPRTLGERRAVATRAAHALGLVGLIPGGVQGTADQERPEPAAAAPPLLEVWLDDVTDAFSEAFAAWPIRLFGLRDGAVRFIAQPVGGMYDLSELGDWLDEQQALPSVQAMPSA